jgi:hypothetical protein
VTNNNGATVDDEAVVIDPNRPLRMTPDAMRALKAATGRTFTDLLQDEDPATQFQVAAFATLYRRAAPDHIPPAVELWERAARTEVVFDASAITLDPITGAASTISPPSVDSGE